MKKVLISLMCIIMVVCMMPGMAFAETVKEVWENCTVDGNKITVPNASGVNYVSKQYQGDRIDVTGGKDYSVIVDLSKEYTHGQLFILSLGFQVGNADLGVDEFWVQTVKSGNDFILTAGYAAGQSITISKPGIYTYNWHVEKTSGPATVTFTVKEATGSLTGTINNTSADSFRYMWAFGRDTESGYKLDIPLTLYTEDPSVAKIGEVGYANLQDAIDAATDGETVTLIKDVQLTEKLTIDKNLTIDGNGKTITGENGNAGVYIDVTAGTFNISNVTLKDFGGAAGTGSGNAVIKVADGASTVAVNATNVNMSNYNRSAYDVRSGALNITGGKLDCANGASTKLTKGILVGGGTNKVTGTISGVEIINADSTYEEWSTSGIEVYNNADINVNNVNIDSISDGITIDNEYFDDKGDVTVKVTNSKVKAKDNAVVIYSKADTKGTATVTIERGDYTGIINIDQKTEKDSISITGGTFTTDPTAYVASGYIVTGNGPFMVSKKQTSGGGGGYFPTTPADPLPAAKTEATNNVNNYVKPTEYEEAEAAEIKAIMDKAAADIKNAKTEEEVKAIEEAAKAEIDKIETAEEKALIRTVEDTKFKARSKATTLKGKKAIKVTWTVPEGMDFDGFEIYRSTEQYKGFGTEPIFTTTKQQYTNNKGIEAGKTYYYKVRAFKYVNDEKAYTEYSYKAIRTVK